MRGTFAPRPAVTPSLDYTFPTPATWISPSGLRVAHVPTPGRLLSMMLVSDGGAVRELPGQEGLATLVTRLRREGTDAISARDFARALDAIGASLTTTTSFEAATISMTVPASELGSAMTLLAHTAIAPSFDPEELVQQRSLQLDKLRQNLAQPSSRADLGFGAACFAPTDRRSKPIAGTETSIAALTRDGVTQFAARYLSPATTTLIVTGDCTRQALEEHLASCFAAWEPSGAESAGSIADHDAVPGQPAVLLIDIPGAVQTEIRLGTVTAGRRTSRWADLTVAGHVVGGPLNSRLSTVLREEKGYTYGVYADLRSAGNAGEFVIGTAVDTESTLPALEDLAGIIAEASTKGLTDAEITSAQTELLGRDGLRFQTAQAIATTIREHVELGLPLGWLNTERNALAAVTAQTASARLAEMALLARPHVVLAGDAQLIEDCAAQVFSHAPIALESTVG